jgi:hypothetical protein
MAGNPKFTLAERRKPAKLEIERDLCLWLDFQSSGSMFAQPLGSLSGQMRNKITKLLIVVVPRRTAGDG